MSDTPRKKMTKIESAYDEMIRDVQMSGEMIAYVMRDKALELEVELTAVTEQLKNAQAELIRMSMQAQLSHEDYKYQKTRADDTLLELNTVTEQRDIAVNDYETAQLLAIRVGDQRDRLAEALRNIKGARLVAVGALDELETIDTIVDEALQSLNPEQKGAR